MGIPFSRANTGITQECLDVTDVRTAFKKVGGKRVTHPMYRDFFGDSGTVNGFIENKSGETD